MFDMILFMRRLPLPFLPLVFVGCQFSASCGNKSINLENAREFISKTLEAESGQKPTSVTCPDKVEIKKDSSFECTASFGTLNAKVTLVQTDDKGGVEMTAVSGILVAAKLEKEIAAAVGQQLNASVTMSCGERVRAAVVGDKVLCDAKDAKGASGKIELTVEDVNGKVAWAAVPSAGAAAPTPGTPEVAPTPAPAGSGTPEVAPTPATP